MTQVARGLRPSKVAMSLRTGIWACLLPACLTLFGCTVQTGLPGPNVILNTPMGPVPVNPPAPVMPGGGLAGPPPGLEPSLQVPTKAVSRNGSYAGRAEVLSTAGGTCLNGIMSSTSEYTATRYASAGSGGQSRPMADCRWLSGEPGSSANSKEPRFGARWIKRVAGVRLAAPSSLLLIGPGLELVRSPAS